MCPLTAPGERASPTCMMHHHGCHVQQGQASTKAVACMRTAFSAVLGFVAAVWQPGWGLGQPQDRRWQFQICHPYMHALKPTPIMFRPLTSQTGVGPQQQRTSGRLRMFLARCA